MQKIIDEEVAKMKAAGMIESSSNAWRSLVVQ